MAVTIQSILQEHFEEFARTHPLAPYQREAAERMRDCRTPALGGHVVGCPNGHVRTVWCNSCRHRSCPQCSAFEREKWLGGWKDRLLRCPHHHIVFTVPHELIPLWRYNKREFGGILFRAGIDTLRTFLADDKYLGAEPGMLAGLHTWDAAGGIHPHLHVMVTAGGLDAAGQWRQPKKDCLLPQWPVLEVFRGKMRDYLLAALRNGKLTVPPDTTEIKIQNLLNRLGRLGWYVKILPRYRNGYTVATYLARYLKGGPIQNGRILDYRDGKVHVRCRARSDAEPTEAGRSGRIVRLDVDDFIARLLEHVPPPDMQTVRGYGLYANSKRAELAQAREHFGQEPRPEKPRLTWGEFCERARIQPTCTCPVCGERLVVLGTWAAGRPPPPEANARAA